MFSTTPTTVDDSYGEGNDIVDGLEIALARRHIDNVVTQV